VTNLQSDHASAHLQELIRRNRANEKRGVYSICSAHPDVIHAGLKQGVADRSLVLIESTSSQVNQFGGYTGQTPEQFARQVRAGAQQAGVPQKLLVLGGDHLGPYPWRNQPAEAALKHARDLVRACVLAGYGKIHLDTSMACADDSGPALTEEIIAARAAALCRVAEDAYAELPAGSPPLLYVVGTEVPTPGGETHEGQAPAVTTVEQLQCTMDSFQTAFQRETLNSAWERVIGLVVQPGVEFGENVIFEYDRNKARRLADSLPKTPCMVYEAHSTDYQPAAALSRMVEDHFAILKVGPALTFVYRETIFALSAIEKELLAADRNVQLSQVREALEATMLRDPSHWQSYYHGREDEQKFARAFSYSDRIRYYWPDRAVQQEVTRLLENLSAVTVPLSVISQYLPREYEAIRVGTTEPKPKSTIEHHIRAVLRDYAAACGAIR